MVTMIRCFKRSYLIFKIDKVIQRDLFLSGIKVVYLKSLFRYVHWIHINIAMRNCMNSSCYCPFCFVCINILPTISMLRRAFDALDNIAKEHRPVYFSCTILSLKSVANSLPTFEHNLKTHF